MHLNGSYSQLVGLGFLGEAEGDDTVDPRSAYQVPKGMARLTQSALAAKGYKNQHGKQLTADGAWGYGTQYAWASAVEHLSNLYKQTRSMATDPLAYRDADKKWGSLKSMLEAFPAYKKIPETVKSGRFTVAGIKKIQTLLKGKGYKDFEGKELSVDGSLGPKIRSAFVSAVKVANSRRIQLKSKETYPFSENLDDYLEEDAIDLVERSDSPSAPTTASYTAAPPVKPTPPPNAPAVVQPAPAPTPAKTVAELKAKAPEPPRASRPETVKKVEKEASKKKKTRRKKAAEAGKPIPPEIDARPLSPKEEPAVLPKKTLIQTLLTPQVGIPVALVGFKLISLLLRRR